MATMNPDIALTNATAKELRDLKITIAVDISGSTAGKIIKTEIGGIRAILSTMDSKDHDTTSVLPWNSATHSVITLPSGQVALDSLTGNGGTTPSCLYTNTSYLEALKTSGVWFLFTDGQINHQEVQNFAQSTTLAGIHGFSNVIVVFGSSAYGPPARVNFSVGITTFALAPDCLFLFHDTSNGTVYLLQAKGCFKCLLPLETDQPVLDSKLTWPMLPRIRYEDLAKVKIPPPKVLSDDQVAFPNGLVIRLKDLFEGTLSDEVAEELSHSREHLKSLSMQAFSRGTVNKFEKWIDSNHQVIAPPPSQRPDVGGLAQHHIKKLLKLMHTSTDEATLNASRILLRAAHDANWAAYQKALSRHEVASLPARIANNNLRKAKSHLKSMSTPKKGSDEWSASVSMGYTNEIDDPEIFNTPESSTTADCFLPGFKRVASHLTAVPSEYAGSCMLCHKFSVLVFLIKTPNSMPKILEKRAGSLISNADFDTVAVLDIFSSSLCCDSCALYLSAPGANLLPQPIAGAIALVSCSNNRKAWIEQLMKVFGPFENSRSILALLSSALDGSHNVEAVAALQDGSTYKNALLWFKEDLKRTVKADADVERLYRK